MQGQLKQILIVLTLTILTACNFRVTKDYLYSRKKIKNGFTIAELSVDSLKENMPFKFIENQSASIGTLDCMKYELRGRTYFYKKTENWRWSYNSQISGDTLPMAIKTNTWYLIRELPMWYGPHRRIFFFINDKGQIKKYYGVTPTNW